MRNAKTWEETPMADKVTDPELIPSSRRGGAPFWSEP
jgi:hypothetical protein